MLRGILQKKVLSVRKLREGIRRLGTLLHCGVFENSLLDLNVRADLRKHKSADFCVFLPVFRLRCEDFLESLPGEHSTVFFCVWVLHCSF